MKAGVSGRPDSGSNEVKQNLDKYGLGPEERRLAATLSDGDDARDWKEVKTNCYFAAVIGGCKVEISGPAEAAMRLIARMEGKS